MSFLKCVKPLNWLVRSQCRYTYFTNLVHSKLLINMSWKTYILVTPTCLHAVMLELLTCDVKNNSNSCV